MTRPADAARLRLATFATAWEHAMPEVVITFCCPSARSVASAGDFNDWSPTAHPMTHDEKNGIWTVRLWLEPGRYEYKFLVDGQQWWNDPNAPAVPNVWGSENSFIDVR
jgi:1,4-alpha-glucan branching enzyme